MTEKQTSKTTKEKSATSAAAGNNAAAPAAGKTVVKIIKFGPYEWQILDQQSYKVLIITEQSIAQRNWNETSDDVRWETCTLRAYLNNEFYNTFSPAEQAIILEVTNETPNTSGPGYEVPGGNSTKDKVFLLSIEEVLRYFGDSTEKFKEYVKTYNAVSLRKMPAPKGFSLVDDFSDSHNKRRVAIRPSTIAELTANEKKKGDVPYAWWTRSRGKSKEDYCAACVHFHGKIYDKGFSVRGVVGGKACVRPALWLKM